MGAASEEASSIPFPPGRRKLHIRSLLLPSQIVTVSLGHNLVSMGFAAPHAILMMADKRHSADTRHPVVRQDGQEKIQKVYKKAAAGLFWLRGLCYNGMRIFTPFFGMA